MVICYIRVSSVEQNSEIQREIAKKYNAEKIFEETVSAKDTNRPELNRMLDFVREGDTLVVRDFSRLARSTKDLLEIVEYLEKKKVELVSDKENIDTSTPAGKLMLTMIGAIYEFERSNLLERQREGIALAKAKGKYKGRKRIKLDNFEELYNKYLNREIETKTELAKSLGISRPKLYEFIKEYEEKNNKNKVN